nr:hypothetical protein CFP56_75878 [Quercus suber]
MVKAQTIKQAKAAFKARNYNPLSDRLKRQIERSIELDNRARRSKEQEKRKAEAIARRKEKERHAREEQKCASVSEQRSCDKYGYESSQYHLEAFFPTGKTGCPGHTISRQVQGCNNQGDYAINEELIGDDSFDLIQDSVAMPVPPKLMLSCPKSDQVSVESFYTSFGLTKKATRVLTDQDENRATLVREHGSKTHNVKEPQRCDPTMDSSNGCKVSFGSVDSDFGLTVEDVEALEASLCLRRDENDSGLMRPPDLPAKSATASRLQMPPVVNKLEVDSGILELKDVPHQIERTFTDKIGFTMSQLESYVDDDLQLTQTTPSQTVRVARTDDILYSKDEDTILGCLVLQETLVECNSHDPAKGISVWRNAAYDKRAALCPAYRSIIRRFSGLGPHPVSAKNHGGRILPADGRQNHTSRVLRNWLGDGLTEDKYLAFEVRRELREMGDFDREGDESISDNQRQIGCLMDPCQ